MPEKLKFGLRYQGANTFQISLHVDASLDKVFQKYWSTNHFFQEGSFISSNYVLLFLCHFAKFVLMWGN